MNLTYDDLTAIRQIVKEEISTSPDIQELKDDVRLLKGVFSQQATDIKAIRVDIRSLKQCTRRLSLQHPDI